MHHFRCTNTRIIICLYIKIKHILIFSKKKNFIFYIFDNHKTKRVKLNVGFASQFRRVLSNSEKKNTFVFRTDELSRHIDFPQIENLQT